jgi:hypothetical protein
MKYQVEKCNLTVTVMDGKLEDIEKGRTDPHAIRVATFDATFDAIHALHGRLYLDWFALTDLAQRGYSVKCRRNIQSIHPAPTCFLSRLNGNFRFDARNDAMPTASVGLHRAQPTPAHRFWARPLHRPAWRFQSPSRQSQSTSQFD